jgi:prepilin-type N-terminal cleavage/methylation domain-containing protein
MNKIHTQVKKGFTLLEILLTIVVIGILATIVLIAINPNRQISQSRNLTRQASINDIYNALQQYKAVNRGNLDINLSSNYTEICDTGSLTLDDSLPTSNYCDGKIDLRFLVPTYLNEIPKDINTVEGETGYQLAVDSSNQISVKADNAELDQELVINFVTPSQTFLVQAGGFNGLDIQADIEKLTDGSSIVVGAFTGTYTFGQGETNATTLVSAGSRDIFVAKYNPNGTLVWAKRAGGTSEDYGATKVVVYPDGSSVVTGSFTDTAVFGQGETNATTLVSAGSRDIFVAKYNANGTLAWAKRAGSTGGAEYGFGLAANADGTVLATGYFEGSATFGQGETNATTLVSAGDADTFLAKYNANGTLAWVKRIGGNSAEWAYGISNNTDGTFVITGVLLSGSVIFGQGETNQTTLSNSGIYNSYIAKYNSDGSLIWAKKIVSTGSSFNWGRDIVMHSDGSSTVSGFFTGPAVFGQGETSEITLTSAGGSDAYIAKYNANGTLAWARRAGGVNDDGGDDIIGTQDGGVIVTGAFEGTAVFAGEGGANAVTLVSAGGRDAYIAKYNSNGALVWARRAGGAGQDAGRGLDINTDGTIFFTGYFQGIANFGQGGNIRELTSIGTTDYFIARYNPDGTLD